MDPPFTAFLGAPSSLFTTCRPRTSLRCCGFTSPSPHLISKPPARLCRTMACSSPPATENLSEIIESIGQQVEEAKAAIAAANDVRAVDEIRVKALGKKGTVSTVMRMVGKLAAKDRPKLGAAVNTAKTTLSELIAKRKEEIIDKEITDQEESEWIDITLPGIRPRPHIGRIHPITSTMDLVTDIFVNIGYDCIDDLDLNREIESDYYCFEALNCPPGHPAREMQDTFYLNEDQTSLLRSQTSAVQIRYMEQNKPPFRILAPGRVYRRDSVDSTHTATFHQVEILAIDKVGELTFGSLRATIIYFLKAMLGNDIETRFRGSYFPFTEPSVEVDVFFRGRWLEVLGCGMVDPAVLENVGLDPKEWGGFAAGFGVERFAMVMHEITDIRELYRNDLRFLLQGMTEPATPAVSLEQVQEDIAAGMYDGEEEDPDLLEPIPESAYLDEEPDEYVE